MARLSRRELKRQVDWRARDIERFIEVQEKAARRDPNKMPPKWRDYDEYRVAAARERCDARMRQWRSAAFRPKRWPSR